MVNALAATSGPGSAATAVAPLAAVAALLLLLGYARRRTR